MYRAVCNVARPACDIADSLLSSTESDVDLSDEGAAALSAMINYCVGEDLVRTITDTCVLHMRFGSSRTPYFLTSDPDVDDDDVFAVDGNLVVERLVSFFVLCLSGEMDVSHSNERSETCVNVRCGEAFLLDACATHSLTSHCFEVKALVVRCLTNTLVVHQRDCVTSSSPAIFERCVGAYFAQYRVRKGALVVRDLVVVNRCVVNTCTLVAEPVVHLSQALAPLRLANAPLLDHVPDACVTDECVAKICARDAEASFRHVPEHHVVGVDSGVRVVYVVQTLYGVWQ